MELKEILDNLCYYDKRNPQGYYEFEDEEIEHSKDDCYCDNCFYGRHNLANELLKLKER